MPDSWVVRAQAGAQVARGLSPAQRAGNALLVGLVAMASGRNCLGL